MLKKASFTETKMSGRFCVVKRYDPFSLKKEENEWYNVFIRLETSLRRSERRMKIVGSRRQLLRQQLHRAFHSECPHYLIVAPL